MKLLLLDDVSLDRHDRGSRMPHHVILPHRNLCRYFARGGERRNCVHQPRSGWRDTLAADSAKCNGGGTFWPLQTARRDEIRAKAIPDRDAFLKRERSFGPLLSPQLWLAPAASRRFEAGGRRAGSATCRAPATGR